jgi:hypothetical protein
VVERYQLAPIASPYARMNNPYGTDRQRKRRRKLVDE